jgi:hypothetical protein
MHDISNDYTLNYADRSEPISIMPESCLRDNLRFLVDYNERIKLHSSNIYQE